MSGIEVIPLPLPHMGAVNAWLLHGEPLTLVDTGPGTDEALVALEAALRGHGLRVEDIDQVLVTHHHLDHLGLAPAIHRRSGARIAMSDGAARYSARFHQNADVERRFSLDLMAAHGVPEQAMAQALEIWELVVATTEPFDADVRLRDGDRIVAGGRTLRVIERPGHSTTDTLYVDDRAALAFVGDHLLADISPNTEIMPVDPANDGGARPRPRPRVDYVRGLEATAAMPLRRLLTGHGRPITDHRGLVAWRLAENRARGRRLISALHQGPATAYELAGELWDARTVRRQALLVVWEVLGVLDLLETQGAVAERVDEVGRSRFALADAPAARAPR